MAEENKTATPTAPAPAVAQAKEVAQQPAAPAPKVKGAEKKPAGKPVYALNRINGDIEPGTIFVPSSEQDLADLEAFGAVRDLTEAEAALFEKTGSTAAADEDALG